jgi:ATP-dependent RNA helicase RhlE
MPFTKFGLHADVQRGVKDLAFTQPTPIQLAAIKPAMEGRDVLACAATGSGKTAAFVLPMLHRLMARPAVAGGRRMVRGLVLTPTRELAAQILEHLESLAAHTPIKGASIIGGVGMGPQAQAFRTGREILIATPGRLLDHMRQPYARLEGLEMLVLDEADRMLDMGFLPDIRRILQVLPTKRQTLFFSATMPAEVRQLMNEMLRDPVRIEIERQAAPAVGITQSIYPVPQHLKTNLLCKLLEGEGMRSVICFTRTKHRANRLAKTLVARGIACVPIHGNRTQGQRTAALSGFKEGQFRVLVATDIAARGIDVQDVTHVVNFDCPHVAEDYIHRVGRTGRAAALGDAFTFVSAEEEGNLRTIERAIGKRLPRVTVPDFDYKQKVQERLEIPIAERLAAVRAERDRGRARRQEGGGMRQGEATRRDGGKAWEGAAGGQQGFGRRPGGQQGDMRGGRQGGQQGGRQGDSRGSHQGNHQGGHQGGQHGGQQQSRHEGRPGQGGGRTGSGQGGGYGWGENSGRGKFGHKRVRGKYRGPARGAR